jgi:hypothetical protein
LLSFIWWLSSFCRFVCSIRLTCSFRRSWNWESCSVTDSKSPWMRWGPLEVEKDLRQDCLVLHFTSSLIMDRFERKSCQWGSRENTVNASKARLNFPYLLGIVTFVQPSPLLYQVRCCPKVFSLLNVCVWLHSDEQTFSTLQKYWTLWHRKIILHHNKVLIYYRKNESNLKRK